VVNLHGIFITMRKRSLVAPDHSFFLFGPRSTGKSTWLREHFPKALWKNLLLDQDYLPLLGDGTQLRYEVEALPAGSWVVINEVQRIPALLNEVHDLSSRFGDRYKFAMSGSSARKLRRMDVNLLAGRAIERRMYPFTSQELADDFNLESSLSFGMLPPVVGRKDYAVDILSAYVSTYLKQEIQQEALVEDMGAFHRFLKIAGIMNGEIINTSAVARDASVHRSTAERYFDILVDTLIGYRLPGWQPKLKVRERAAPKFYLFDCGVVRALTDRARNPLSSLESGKLLETLVLSELRSAISYQNLGGELAYWRTAAGKEVDFIWSRGDSAIAVELKMGSSWRRSYSKALTELAEAKLVNRCYGVYGGERQLKDGVVTVLPVRDFLEQLHGGQIIVG